MSQVEFVDHAQVQDRPQWGDDLWSKPSAGQLVPVAPKVDTYAPYMAPAQSFQRPGPDKLVARAKRIGEMMAKDAFYSFRAGKGMIEGPSVYLAKALANDWGAVAFGVEILEESEGRVKLAAKCVDLCQMVIVQRESVHHLAPPAGGFAKDIEQRERWRTMQTNSAGSKTLRGAILDCLPAWYVDAAFEAAKDIARKNIRKGLSMSDAIEAAAKHWLSAFKVTKAQLVAFVGQPEELWTDGDLLRVEILFGAIRSGETTIEEAFGAAPAKPAEGDRLASAGLGKPPPQASQAAAPAPAPEAPTPAPRARAPRAPKAPEVSPEMATLRTEFAQALQAFGAEMVLAAVKALNLVAAGATELPPVDIFSEAQLRAIDEQIGVLADEAAALDEVAP